MESYFDAVLEQIWAQYMGFNGSNGGKLEGLLPTESLGSTDGKLLGSDEVVKLGI